MALWKQPSDGPAAAWQIPDEANVFGIAGLRLFNLIPPFDDCKGFFFYFLKAWEIVQRRVYAEGKSLSLCARADTCTPLLCDPALLRSSTTGHFQERSPQYNNQRDGKEDGGEAAGGITGSDGGRQRGGEICPWF